jgi:prefoldin subunit 5
MNYGGVVMTEVEMQHAQAIDFTSERLNRLEKDMAHMQKSIDELHTMLASFMKAITDYQEANDNE